MLELDKANFMIKHTKHSSDRVPYPFQLEAMKKLSKIKVHNPDGFSTMLVIPTGAGKTYTAVRWILSNYVDKNVKVLWIAHRSELLRQATETFFAETTDENTFRYR